MWVNTDGDKPLLKQFVVREPGTSNPLQLVDLHSTLMNLLGGWACLSGYEYTLQSAAINKRRSRLSPVQGEIFANKSEIIQKEESVDESPSGVAGATTIGWRSAARPHAAELLFSNSLASNDDDSGFGYLGQSPQSSVSQ